MSMLVRAIHLQYTTSDDVRPAAALSEMIPLGRDPDQRHRFAIARHHATSADRGASGVVQYPAVGDTLGAIEQVVECLVLVAVSRLALHHDLGAVKAPRRRPTASDPMCDELGHRLPPTHE